MQKEKIPSDLRGPSETLKSQWQKESLRALPGRVAAQISRCARLRASSRCARLRRRACAGRRGEDPASFGLGSLSGSTLAALKLNRSRTRTRYAPHRVLSQTSAQAERHTWRPRTNPCQPFEFTGSRGFPVNTHSHTRTQGHISSHEETADTPGKAKGRERGRGRGRRQRRRSSDRWQRSLLRLSRSAVCVGCVSGEGASLAARGHAAAAASSRALRAR